jgi:phenylpropionate dioxygenase-like ring-hydroxylating dioxygenase large terminal subunit
MYINFWYPICTSAELGDEKPVRAQVLKTRFAAFRDSNGQAHVLSDTCVHRGGALGNGKIQGDCIQCPYHGWEYDADGRCRKIPAINGKKPPARAKVDSYPVQERYGIVFAFLGDLPEGERPPLSEIPEYDEDGWRPSDVAILELNAYYERSMENGLDPAHNEFVHPLQGSPAFDYERVAYDDKPWGTRTYTVGAPQRQGETELQALRTDQNDVWAESWTHGPNALVTAIHLSKTNDFVQYFYEQPVDENRTRIFFINTRNCMLEPENDENIMRINLNVAEEDIAVIEALFPVRTPDSKTKELLGVGDENIVRFRELLDGWRAKGWRIDLQALRERPGDIAYAIPSPARRESGNWVLDSIPLVGGN